MLLTSGEAIAELIAGKSLAADSVAPGVREQVEAGAYPCLCIDERGRLALGRGPRDLAALVISAADLKQAHLKGSSLVKYETGELVDGAPRLAMLGHVTRFPDPEPRPRGLDLRRAAAEVAAGIRRAAADGW